MRHKLLFLAFAVLFLLTALLPRMAAAETPPAFNYQAFAEIPVLHGGRIRPLDSFARIQLRSLSDRDKTVEGDSAVEWLAQTIFTPYEALQKRVFLIRNPELKNMLKLPKRRGHLYSYGELSPGLDALRDTIARIAGTPQKDWTQAQNELIELQRNSHSFKQLLSAVSLLLPLAIDLPQDIREKTGAAPDAALTYLDAVKAEEHLKQRVIALHADKGAEIDRYTAQEIALVEAAFALEQIAREGVQSKLLRIIPPAAGESTQDWLSPWDAMLSGHISPQNAGLNDAWRALAAAYQAEDTAAWQGAAEKARDTGRQLAATQISTTRLAMELSYNRTAPLKKSALFYGLGFFLLIGFLLFPKVFPARKIVIATLGVGAFYHFSAIVVRVIVLMRPPVGTLYESVLFVGLICVLTGFLIEFRRRDNAGLLLAAISGAVLGLVSLGRLAGPDDMNVLVAVLNTNFWLTTHVLMITAGYAFAIITALIAHLVLYLRLFGRKEKSDLLLPALQKSALIALLFTATGTVLGGVWADQSWGRFWGWDPKENGALLIVLWLLWILHGRLSGHIRRLGMIAGMAFLNVIVALSWFGVNLLNVGLHSYGFIDSVFWSLTGFCTIETLIIGIPYLRLLKSGKERSA
ncbi:MAG: cytochrome c biogenesis protein CcsA [Pseudomonadota bacterium]|nr:MAG: cytochrome c biogenesis protein CcsA [Pseudomonadota bacterium]